jgi:hypothetical protein
MQSSAKRVADESNKTRVHPSVIAPIVKAQYSSMAGVGSGSSWMAPPVDNRSYR